MLAFTRFRKSQVLPFGAIVLIIAVNVLIANTNLYEDNYIYYLWYKNGRSLGWNNDPIVTLLFNVFPKNLPYFGWKVCFIVVLIGVTWYTWARKSSLFALFLFFTNLVCLDMFFNTTRSTVASFMIFYGLTHSKNRYFLLLISVFVHFEYTIVILGTLCLSRVVSKIYLLLPLLYFSTMVWVSLPELIQLEVYNRAVNYKIEVFLPQWYLPSLFVVLLCLYTFNRARKSRLFLFRLLLVILVSLTIVAGFQYGYRGIPLLLLFVLHELKNRELLAFSFINFLLTIFLIYD